MGFLQRTSGTELDFKKVVISSWFRVPAVSGAAAEARAGNVLNFGQWNAVLPLLTWGTQTVGQTYPINAILLGHEDDFGEGGDVFGTEVGAAEDVAQGPGYIGIKFHPSLDNPVLEAYIPLSSAADCTNCAVIVDGYLYDPPEIPGIEYTFADVTYTQESFNDHFGGQSTTAISADTIYHLLISWDLSSGSASEGFAGGRDISESIISDSLMYAALNDTNLTEAQLPMIWPGSESEEYNGNRHVSYQTYNFAGSDDLGVGIPSVTTSVSSVSTDPISVPGPPSINDVGIDPPVLKVEMLDLQIFTGVSLDTSVEANRRAFITSDGRPASPALAVALMGKDPEIRFQTRTDWKTGNNRGTAGSFVPTGTINDYDFNF